MPQAILPIFPDGVTHINSILAFHKNEAGQIVYFNGTMPLFTHDQNDKESFKMITAQFCVSGSAKQVEIARAFGIKIINVKRAVKLYREEGPKSFFIPQKRRGAVVLTAEVVKRAQALLDDYLAPAEVAKQLSIKPNTLSKAIKAGKLHTQKKSPERNWLKQKPA